MSSSLPHAQSNFLTTSMDVSTQDNANLFPEPSADLPFASPFEPPLDDSQSSKRIIPNPSLSSSDLEIAAMTTSQVLHSSISPIPETSLDGGTNPPTIQKPNPF
jgi:hypothetical protein